MICRQGLDCCYVDSQPISQSLLRGKFNSIKILPYLGLNIHSKFTDYTLEMSFEPWVFFMTSLPSPVNF